MKLAIRLHDRRLLRPNFRVVPQTARVIALARSAVFAICRAGVRLAIAIAVLAVIWDVFWFFDEVWARK